MTILLTVAVQSSITPVDLRARMEAEYPDFEFRSGTSGVQGGIYVSATSVGIPTLTVKVWFYDDEPDEFSFFLTEVPEADGTASRSPSSSSVSESFRRFLEELGSVSDRT